MAGVPCRADRRGATGARHDCDVGEQWRCGVSTLRITRLEPAMSGGWWLAFAAADLATFTEAKEIVRALPAYERQYHPDERAWWISAGAMQILRELLPDVDAALRMWRQGDETGETSGASSRRRTRNASAGNTGRRSPAARIPTAVADSIEGVPGDTVDAFAALHLLPSAPAELVKAAHRITAKRLHPDRGGDHRRMVAANLAAEQALLWAETHEERTGAA